MLVVQYCIIEKILWFLQLKHKKFYFHCKAEKKVVDDIIRVLFQSESDFEGVASYFFFPFPIISPSAMKTSLLMNFL